MPHLINHSSLPQRTFAAALCCTLSLAAFPCYAQAAPSSQELAQERKELEAELAEAQSQLDQLEGEIEEIQQELAEREAQLEATREEADATKVQVDETNQQLTERRGELGSHMRDSYKMGSSNLMRFLFGATSFEDLASRIYYLDKVSEARAEEIDEVNRLAAELATRQQELEEAQARQQAEVEEVESKTAEYEDMIAQAQEYYDGLDEEVRAKIAEEEAAREAEEAARKAAEEAARKAEEEQKSKDSGTAAGSATSASPSSDATSTQDFGSVSSVSVASGVYEQSEPAMVGFNTKSYTTVANQYFGIQSSKNYQHMGNYNSSKQRLSYAGGDMSLEFETYVQLPVTLDYSGDLGNPQAVCISADGSTAYVSYPEGHGHDSSQMGRIVRYNLALLREYGAMEGDMSAFATGVRLGDEKWRSCMTVGPRINMGHGQCMAIDPSTGYLWLSTRGASEYSDLTLIDTGSLSAVRQIRFHTGGTDFGSVITFDEYGNFYYVKRSGSTWGSSPAGSLRIYQGRISDNLDKVLIKLLPQSVKNPAGTTLQSVSWDTTTDTLYVINDSAILAVSMNPLLSGSLTAGNVRTEFFSPLREFEGMAFDAGGKAYLLVNRQAELMCLG